MLQNVFISLISETNDITKIQCSMTATADDGQQSYRSCYTRLDNISQLKITRHVIRNKCLLSPVTGNTEIWVITNLMSYKYFKNVRKKIGKSILMTICLDDIFKQLPWLGWSFEQGCV